MADFAAMFDYMRAGGYQELPANDPMARLMAMVNKSQSCVSESPHRKHHQHGFQDWGITPRRHGLKWLLLDLLQ